MSNEIKENIRTGADKLLELFKLGDAGVIESTGAFEAIKKDTYTMDQARDFVADVGVFTEMAALATGEVANKAWGTNPDLTQVTNSLEIVKGLKVDVGVQRDYMRMEGKPGEQTQVPAHNQVKSSVVLAVSGAGMKRVRTHVSGLFQD